MTLQTFSAVPHLQNYLSNRLIMTSNNMTHQQCAISLTTEKVAFEILSLCINVRIAEF